MPKRITGPRRGLRRSDNIDPDLLMQLAIGPRAFSVREVPIENGEAGLPAIMLRVVPPLSQMELTVMPVSELETLRRFINETIDEAVKVSAVHDRRAKDGLERGETTSKRLWRPDVSILRFREPWPKGEDVGPSDPRLNRRHEGCGPECIVPELGDCDGTGHQPEHPTATEAREESALNYIASIMNEEGTGLVEVDLRTLDRERLERLRLEAAEHGDPELVASVNAILLDK